MAKKTNRVSINALERFCKEKTPDIMQRTFSIGDETITYEVKFRLTLEESMRFIEDVVKEAIMPNDGMIVPLAQSYIIGKNILVYYANFTMPNDESKAYELVLGANGIIGDIIGCIDNAQYQMLLAGVRDRVNFETQKMLSVQEQRVNTLVGEISRFAEQMDSVFGNISGEQMAGFISSMSKLSDTQISTEELAKAFVENAKENN
jgi:hypothetical protein